MCLLRSGDRAMEIVRRGFDIERRSAAPSERRSAAFATSIAADSGRGKAGSKAGRAFTDHHRQGARVVRDTGQ